MVTRRRPSFPKVPKFRFPPELRGLDRSVPLAEVEEVEGEALESELVRVGNEVRAERAERAERRAAATGSRTARRRPPAVA